MDELYRLAQTGDATALLELSRLAENGDADALLRLGDIYWVGDVVEKDMLTARRHWLSAHDRKNVMATSRILNVDG